MATLLRAFALVVAGALAGLAFNAVRKERVSLALVQESTQCEGAAAAVLIDPRETASMCSRADVVIADTRPESRFAEGHVAGALHLPCDARGEVASSAMARLDGARTIVVYGERTEDARPVAETLLRRRPGADVRVLDGGFEAWSRAGLACASGACNGDCAGKP